MKKPPGKDSRGMSLIGVLAIVAVVSVVGLTIATLVDQMSRSATRIALIESIASAERSVLLCIQKTGTAPPNDCGSCFFANPPPDPTQLQIPALGAGLVTQNIGSIRNNGLVIATAGAALPGENRLTVQSIQFVESAPSAQIPARASSTIGGVQYTTLYGNIVLTFAGPAGLLGGSAFSAKSIPVALSRRDAAPGIVDICGMGSPAANFVCTTGNATNPPCPGGCSPPATLQSVVTNFNQDGVPVCGCFCLPSPTTIYNGPPGAAGPPGPPGAAVTK